MSLSDAAETAWLQHYFQNADIANIGDATGLRGSTTAGSFHWAAHTAYPGEAGSAQTTNEATFGAYARQAAARSSAGFTVSGNTVSNNGAVTFPEATGAPANDIAFLTVGKSGSGAGEIVAVVPLASARYVGTGKASNNVITLPGHALSVGQKVCFLLIPGGSLPGGITAGQIYFVLTVSGNDITISTTSGGSELDITADGVVAAYKMAVRTVSEGISLSFPTGNLTIVAD